MVILHFYYLALYCLIVREVNYKRYGMGVRASRPRNRRVMGDLTVSSVNFQAERNSREHKTDLFKTPSIVLRRGQVFYLDIDLNVEYEARRHRFNVELETGHKPRVFDRTKIVIPIVKNIEPKKWGAMITGQNGKVITIKINIPADCLVGQYRLNVVSRTGHFLYQHNAPVYILFNPWSKDDEVYMPNDDWLDEYILNDQGVLFQGSAAHITPFRWYYGQFETVALDLAWELIRQTSVRGRDTAREVARRISAQVNANDDGGVVLGNWGKDYSDGIEPWAWTGSPAIMEQYMKTRKPVKYGQCWVFCGVSTTILRALGIPTRSISNFNSAHDTDGNCTYDRYYDENGEFMPGESADSTWNFHCWNDCWMARPDLTPGYGGWQAVDATPQEPSKGLFQLGPAPLKAVKEGNVDISYDTKFVFAEVNADTVYWARSGPKEPFIAVDIKPSLIGQKISTKAIGKNNWQRIDITDDYKYKEGSTLERGSVRRALRLVGNTMVTDAPLAIAFNLAFKPKIPVNEDVVMRVEMRNTQAQRATITTTIGANVVMYNGVAMDRLASRSAETIVNGYASRSQAVIFPANLYMDYLRDNPRIRFHIMSTVKETGQVFVDEQVVVIERPELKFEGIYQRFTVGERMTFYIVITNPLHEPLTKCELRMDGNLVDSPLTLPQRDIRAKEIFRMPVSLVPEFSGRRDIIASFTSSQLGGFRGSTYIDVQPQRITDVTSTWING